MEIEEIEEIKIFDVVKNSLSGELGVVMKVTGELLDLRGKDGVVVRYKFGKHFHRVPHDEAVDFRAAARAALKQFPSDKPKRKRTASAFLNRLKKR